MTHRSTLGLFALVCLVATIGYAQNRGNSDREHLDGGNTNASLTPVADRQGDNSEDPGFRLREGMKFVNQVGVLKEAGGGRIAFYPDGSSSVLQLLENLALERVLDELNQPHRKWSVTGVVTEYRSSNYLLLHRAVLKARASPGARPRP